MNVDLDGRAIFIQRMTNETDMQLRNRKDFILRIAKTKRIEDDQLTKRIDLSRFYHGVYTKGLVYDKSIHDKLNE